MTGIFGAHGRIRCGIITAMMSLVRGLAVAVIVGVACARPATPNPAPVAPVPASAPSGPADPSPPEVSVPKLPIAIEQVTTCVIESGRAQCNLGRASEYEFPFDGVRALAASTGIVCAIHDEFVDCHLGRSNGRADLRFDAPGAVELVADYNLVCVKTLSQDVHCHHINTETNELSPMAETLVASGVIDFELDHSSLVYIDADGTTWLAPLKLEEDSDGMRYEIVDELDVPVPKAKRVSSNVRTVAVVTEQAEVWEWHAPKRRVDRVEPAKRITGLEEAFDVVAHNGAVCATTPRGVWCTGDNVDGQLGPTPEFRDVPLTQMPVPGTPPAIEASWGKFCAGDADSPPYCWGNSSWPVGLDLYKHPDPVVERGSVAIDAGSGRICSRDEEGRRTCYGRSSDIMQHPFDLDRGWEPDFAEAVRRTGSCDLGEDGTLRCLARQAPGGRVVEAKVSRFSTNAEDICYVRGDRSLGCTTAQGSSFDVQGVSDAVDVALLHDRACVLTTNGTATCFDIPEKPKLRKVEDGDVERFVYKPRLRRLREAKALTEIEASDTFLCGLNGATGTIDCWKRGRESKKPQRLEVTAKTLRLTEFFGCGLTIESRPYCFRAKDDLKTMDLRAPFDRAVEEFEFYAGRFWVGPLCIRDAQGRVDCESLYPPAGILWPPAALTWPFE